MEPEEIFRGGWLRAQRGRTAVATAAYFEGEAEIYASLLAGRRRPLRDCARAGNRRSLRSAFIDLDFGSGRTCPERVRGIPTVSDLAGGPQEQTFPGGENLDRVRERAWEGLLKIVGENPERTVLIVSHRVITKVLICAALGLNNSHFWQIKQDTTAINCLEYSRGAFTVSLLNDTCHLKSLYLPGGRKDFDGT
jgi:broad specificity phosphatase PhoE